MTVKPSHNYNVHAQHTLEEETRCCSLLNIINFKLTIYSSTMCSECMVHLKTMFPSPPARVFFGRHVYDWHNVPHLDPRERDDQKEVTAECIQPHIMMGSELQRGFSCLLCTRSYLEGQLICGLGCVTFGDVRSSDGRNVDRGFFGHQQVVPLVVDLENKKQHLSFTSEIPQILHANCSCHTVPWSVCHTVKLPVSAHPLQGHEPHPPPMCCWEGAEFGVAAPLNIFMVAIKYWDNLMEPFLNTE